MTTAISRVDEVKGNLAKMAEAGQFPLPKHIHPERFLAVAQMVLTNSPDLVVKCEVPTIYKAVSDAAQDGLFPDGREGAIVPFKGKAKWMPMVAGICKKARNSGEISVIDSQVVYEKDAYEFWTDEKGPHFKHVKFRGERGNPILTYAYALGKDGGCFFEEIDEAQMKAIEAKSNAGDSPWKGPFKDEMRRKSALRRLAKYRLPNSSDLDTLFKQDNEFYEDPDETEDENKAPKKASRVHTIIDAEATVVEDAPAAAKPATAAPAPATTAQPKPAPAAKPAPTAQEAAKMAQDVFPGSKVVNQPPAAPPAAKPLPKKEQATVFVAKGLIADLKVKDIPQASGTTRRYACKIGNLWYGSWEKKVYEQMETACNAKAELTVNFKERKEGENIYRDVVSVSFVAPQEDGEPVSEAELPI